MEREREREAECQSRRKISIVIKLLVPYFITNSTFHVNNLEMRTFLWKETNGHLHFIKICYSNDMLWQNHVLEDEVYFMTTRVEERAPIPRMRHSRIETKSVLELCKPRDLTLASSRLK